MVTLTDVYQTRRAGLSASAELLVVKKCRKIYTTSTTAIKMNGCCTAWGAMWEVYVCVCVCRACVARWHKSKVFNVKCIIETQQLIKRAYARLL